jgi:RimJ/RimL family protein N-acetyltransferase
MSQLATPRLRLGQWRQADLGPFAALNADPEVMRYFPAPMTREQSDQFAAHVQATIARQGWGLWAVEIVGSAPFIGFVGLNQPRFEAHFTPAIEVGWRLDRRYWGHGYATEAAAASLTFGFDRLDCAEIVSFTAKVNDASRRVMQRLGMSHDPADDFDHPAVPDDPLRRHVLFRVSRESWRKSRTISAALIVPRRNARASRTECRDAIESVAFSDRN